MTVAASLTPFTATDRCPRCGGWPADDATPICHGYTRADGSMCCLRDPGSPVEIPRLRIVQPTDTPTADIDVTALLARVVLDPFAPYCLQLAAGLMRHQPGEYERLVALIKALPEPIHNFRFRPWEDAVKAAARAAARMVTGPWAGQLLRNRDGDAKAALANVVTLLERDEAWAGVLAWNEHSHTVEWHRPPPWPDLHAATTERGTWSERQDTLLVCYVERALGFSLRPSQIRSVVRSVALCRSFHPIRQYLERLEWDGVPRVPTWLQVYLGAGTVPDGGEPGDAQSEDYLTDVGRWMLVGAVVRAVRPGVKLDEMVVLEGGQGTFKSTAIKVLGGEWYVEVDAATLGTLDKDTLMVARTAWILEAGEFDSLSGASMERVKSMVTRATDTYRVPYGAEVESFARGWCGVGSSNGETYLRDPSGARRFHPVRIGRVDIPALTRDRDQLWAEAFHLQREGGLWYPTGDTSTLVAEQEKRYQVDAWQERVDSYLASRLPGDLVTIPDVLHDALKLDPRDMNRTAEMRVGACLKHAHWIKGTRRRRGGILVYPWRAPSRVPGEEG